MSRFSLALTALRELGFSKLISLAIYRLGLNSGHYLRITTAPIPRTYLVNLAFKEMFDHLSASNYNKLGIDTTHIIAEADAICRGEVHLFGGELVPLDLTPQSPLAHWTAYERGHATWGSEDIKYIWEPARFSWGFTLARAYCINPDEAYSQAFWRYFEQFQRANPPYLGPNWTSAQEAALRIMVFSFCDQIFFKSEASTPERRQILAQSIAEHAERILPTLVYARSQNNNHLLSEALGLYTASLYLPEHPSAFRWRKSGWSWFNWGIPNQISSEGTYMQHSVNYHRLMLQLALWMNMLARLPGAEPLSEPTKTRLVAAVRWLQALVDPETGRVPNLGANDSACILPLSSLPQEDYRPTLQAAGAAFLGHAVLPPGAWDELSAWLGIKLEYPSGNEAKPQAADMPCVEIPKGRAFLRAANFSDRPSHADQLSVDLWFQGQNIAMDPGTYAYNAAPPWQNVLAVTQVHNTLSLNDRSQMNLASRFLWLNWAQADILERLQDETGRITAITAQHDGYKKLGWLHQRTLAAPGENHFIIDDLLIPTRRKPQPITARLAWLVPDLPWCLDGNCFKFELDNTSFSLTITGADLLAVVRAGKCILGDLKPQPFWGWYSPTYGQKIPALHLIAITSQDIKPFFSSRFKFN